jgi:hypothetical protein
MPNPMAPNARMDWTSKLRKEGQSTLPTMDALVLMVADRPAISGCCAIYIKKPIIAPIKAKVSMVIRNIFDLRIFRLSVASAAHHPFILHLPRG